MSSEAIRSTLSIYSKIPFKNKTVTLTKCILFKFNLSMKVIHHFKNIETFILKELVNDSILLYSSGESNKISFIVTSCNYS